jgi:serine protease AprX
MVLVLEVIFCSVSSDDAALSHRSELTTAYIDQKGGLKTGEVAAFETEINGSNVPFKVTMVYSDYPGPGLINNLNLVVTDPNGKRYHGNIFEEPLDSRLDTVNNIEVVF